ncbi:hypothetical protein GOP47_0018655 [Adiantum capillus-veneris]|uniref:HAT C-terminal dimerisation domain-containing protein n=1 Tax=Adiantum capillus-veneris TaxID=13818 RepID=A0A9D4UF27_ADICA|nr:hypothetical protein GOP47_0018655 [Adiantum capillus-veneris]
MGIDKFKNAAEEKKTTTGTTVMTRQIMIQIRVVVIVSMMQKEVGKKTRTGKMVMMTRGIMVRTRMVVIVRSLHVLHRQKVITRAVQTMRIQITLLVELVIALRVRSIMQTDDYSFDQRESAQDKAHPDAGKDMVASKRAVDAVSRAQLPKPRNRRSISPQPASGRKRACLDDDEVEEETLSRLNIGSSFSSIHEDDQPHLFLQHADTRADEQLIIDSMLVSYMNNLGKLPLTWWQVHGRIGLPKLCCLALYILSQDCYTKIHNRLSTSLLKKLVYCRANMRLVCSFHGLGTPKQIP